METAPKQGRIRRNSVGILTALGLLFSSSVAGVVGWASWQHIVEVGRSVGEPSAVVLPVAIDGLMLTGTVMGAVDRLRGYKTRGWAVAALWTGSLLTLAFNMFSAWERGLVAMSIAVLFAVTLLIAVETMFHPSQRPLTKTAKKVAEIVSNVVSTPEPAPAPVETPKPEPVAAAAAKRGRKPGPQPNQPRKRTGGRPRFQGAGDGREKTPVKAQQVLETAKVEPIMEKPDPVPPAMGERLSDMVGSSSEREVPGTVVS